MSTPLIDALIEATGDTARVSARALDRHAAAHDASHFLLTPQVVVTARNAAEVGRLFAVSARHRVPLTLRSGGTSLSGQAVTDGILVDVRKSFRTTQVLDDGARVRTQPGVTVLRLNAELARYGRKIGPDPASESACTIGGVVANNSSGMACGTVENTYRTLDSMVVVLPSGTVVDTGAPDADGRLRHDEPEIFNGLLRLRDRVRANPASVAKIRQQFAMKNTMGYGLNALLDFDDPCQILAHLVVGSEGTLGFVAEVTLHTVALRAHASSALLVFDDLGAANSALPDLVSTGAATLELMDATSLRVGQRLPDAPAQIATLDVSGQAALLLEYQSTDRDELLTQTEAAAPVLAGLPLQHPAELTADPAVRGRLWKLRKGLYASVAGARASGTTALLEDVVVPVKLLADTCAGLHELFDRYRYRDSVIFGHAKDGNIHFLITDRFADDEPLRRYADFTEDMVDLVLAQGGSLKAEHGTGRVMAPFVRRQYGDELYDVMVGIKRLIDPAGLLNPGVLLDDAPDAHLRHIKVTPTVEEEVDRCVECGYCEPVCPSRDLTLTPRQRIVLRRAMATAEAVGDQKLADELARVLRLSRPPDLRRGRHVRHGVPGADQHRRLGAPAAPGEPQPAGRAGLGAGRQALGHRQQGGEHRADRCGRGSRRAARDGKPRRPRRGRHRHRAAVVGGASARRPAPAPAGTGGRTRRGVPAGLCQRDVRPGRRRPRCAGQCRKAVRAGRSQAADPK